jgi:Rps23 Pro-64 3,4-dihydroxylase Tpa1-like proline 4-hydroxylase
MAERFDHPNFCVVDDFLDEATWTAIWTDFQFLELHPVTRTLGAWKLSDGVPLGGQEVVLCRTSVTPPGSSLEQSAREQAACEQAAREQATREQSALEQVVAAILAKPECFAGLIGDDWDRVSARPYVYPQGTGLSWHVDDHELYAGAFIYYAHPHWNAHWGGELLVAERDLEAEAELGEMPIMAHRFETESYSERLLAIGCGNFVSAKPNRLVFLAGAPHMVSQVLPAAGAAVRASVAGFFLRPESASDRSTS